MFVTCLDLEGVLVPEIWIAFAEETGIPELKLTTRDIADYDVLMNKRIKILEEKGLGLKEIQAVIEKIEPLPGAKEFLDELRTLTQVIILSDTFTQFAAPLMKKLGMPTIFCNELIVSPQGMKALQSIGYDTIASGDSFNDLAMIQSSQYGFLFRAPQHIINDYPTIPAFTEYSQLLQGVKEKISKG